MGAEPAVVASLEPKSVTTAIALSLSANSGGIPALTSVVVIVVGVFGGIVGPWVLRKVGVESRIAKGLAMGAAAHAMGTARAMELGAVEGAISGLAIGLMASPRPYWFRSSKKSSERNAHPHTETGPAPV